MGTFVIASIGEPVQYVGHDGEVLPALILRVHPEQNPNLPATYKNVCDLVVFCDDDPMTVVIGKVPMEKDVRSGGVWRYPRPDRNAGASP